MGAERVLVFLAGGMGFFLSTRDLDLASPLRPISLRTLLSLGNVFVVRMVQTKAPGFFQTGRVLSVDGYLNYGCVGAFAFVASILLFNAICCSGVSTLFTLVLVAWWSSFIFAFFWSSLSEASFIMV